MRAWCHSLVCHLKVITDGGVLMSAMCVSVNSIPSVLDLNVEVFSELGGLAAVSNHGAVPFYLFGLDI